MTFLAILSVLITTALGCVVGSAVWTWATSEEDEIGWKL